MRLKVSVNVRVGFAAIGFSGDIRNRSLLQDLLAQILIVIAVVTDYVLDR
jgi:hypothetical protein